MSNLIFPQTIGLKMERTKTPIWKTIIHTTPSGKETRTAMMSYPRWQFVLSFEFLRDDTTTNELKALMGFYNALQGAFDTFLYSDPYDYHVTAQSFGTGNGTTTIFPLIRSMGTYNEPITNLNGNPSIYVDGVLKTLTTDYTITNGVVTFVVAPASGKAVTWTGSFYYRCRFLNDTLDFKQFMYDLWENSKIEFISVK